MTVAQPGTRGFLNAEVIADEARAIADADSPAAVHLREIAKLLRQKTAGPGMALPILRN